MSRFLATVLSASRQRGPRPGGWLWKQSAANRSLGSKFPANREMNSEFRRNSTPKAFQVAAKHLRLLPYRLNTHCKELGNSYRVNSEYPK